MRNSKTLLSVVLALFFLASGSQLQAVTVTLTNVSGLDICSTPAGVPVTYTANAPAGVSLGTCNIQEWRVTGGTIFVNGSNVGSAVNFVDAAFGKCNEKACLTPGVPCIPGFNGVTSTVVIRWNAGATSREVKVKAKRELGTLGTYTSEDSEKASIPAASSITRQRGRASCTGATFVANVPSSNCNPVNFQWTVNGSNFTTSGNTLTIGNFNNLNNANVSVTVNYGNGLTAGPTSGFFSSTVTTPFISGPSKICDGSFNSFDLVAIPGPTSIFWQSSSSAITIDNPSSPNILVFVTGSPPSSFTLSCTVTQCGVTRVLTRQITVGTPGAGDCPPIPRGPKDKEGDSPDDNLTLSQSEAQNQVESGELEKNEKNANRSFDGMAVTSSARRAATPYPNPVEAGETAYIPLKERPSQQTLVAVYNSMGQRVSRQELLPGQPLFELSTTGYTPGIYYISIQQEGKQTTHILTVQ